MSLAADRLPPAAEQRVALRPRAWTARKTLPAPFPGTRLNGDTGKRSSDMRHLMALALAGVFALGASSAAFAACVDGHQSASNPATVADADQAAPSTKIKTPKSGS